MATMTEDDGDIKIEEQKIPDEKIEIDLTEDELKQEQAAEDERTAKGDADDHAEGDREAIRERRRQEKAERKERREKAMTRDRIEMDFLRKRNDDLERRLNAQEQRAQQGDLRMVDTEIQRAIDEAKLAEDVMAKAIAASNGEDATQAMRYRDEAIARAQQLYQYKQQQEAAAKQPQQPQVDPQLVTHAQDFLEDHPWYDVNGSDEDSAIVLAIDQRLVQEGFNPTTDEYWDELRDRVQRRFPEKFNADAKAGGKRAAPAVERTPRGGPAVGSGKEHAPTSTRREVYISAERKQALIDAGVWDDPQLRNKYIKKYMEYDRANGRS